MSESPLRPPPWSPSHHSHPHKRPLAVSSRNGRRGEAPLPRQQQAALFAVTPPSPSPSHPLRLLAPPWPSIPPACPAYICHRYRLPSPHRLLSVTVIGHSLLRSSTAAAVVVPSPASYPPPGTPLLPPSLRAFPSTRRANVGACNPFLSNETRGTPAPLPFTKLS